MTQAGNFCPSSGRIAISTPSCAASSEHVTAFEDSLLASLEPPESVTPKRA
jgi:hypothetical protein